MNHAQGSRIMRPKSLETGCYNGINQILGHYIDMKWF